MSYTIKLLSRNINIPSVINETDLTPYVLQGFSFVEKLDEGLDIGSMVINGVSRFEPYDMFDTIEVSYNSVVKFSMRVAGDSVELLTKNPLSYRHTLSLVEHTKILERYLISGKTFTQPTDINATRLTLYDVINDLRLTIPIEDELIVADTRIFEMPTAGTLLTFLQATESPEFTFKGITFKDALMQIGGSFEGIPRLVRESDGTLRLTFDLLDEFNSLISDNAKLTNRNTQQDISLYATNIVSDVQNLVSDNDISEGVEIYPSEGAWITPRSDKYIFSYSDSYIRTPKRIYNVNKLEEKLYVQVNQSGDVDEFYNYKLKYFIFDTFADFPVSPPFDGSFGSKQYYVAIDTETHYLWNGSTYTVDISNPIQDATPKIRVYETFADFFIFTGETSGSYEQDVFVDNSTGKTYRYNGTTYSENSSFNEDGLIVLDLTDRVFERALWNTLDSDDTDRLDDTKFYKSNTLAYDYRQPNIQLGTTSGLFDVNVDILTINKLKVHRTLVDDGYIDGGIVGVDDIVLDYDDGSFFESNSYNSMLFKTHYTPIPESQRIDISKKDTNQVKYYSELSANQQSRSVNLDLFTNNLGGRINRIGNAELNLYNKISSLDSADYFNLKDYTSDNYIITVRETIIFNNVIEVSYGLIKNFNMVSKFTGVNSEIRQYEIGENNTIQRVITRKEYAEIDIVASGVGGNSSSLTDDGVKCLLDTFKTDSLLEPVRGGWSVSESNIPFLSPFSSNGGGDTLIFFHQLKDNVNVEDARNDSLNESQIIKRFIRYTDTDGKADTIQFNLFDRLYVQDLNPNIGVTDGDQIPNIDVTQVVKTYVESPTLTIKKDNRELLGQLYEIGLHATDYEKVILGRILSRRNRMVTERPPVSLKLYTYRNDVKLNRTHTLNPPPSPFNTATLSTSNIVIDYVNCTVTISHPNMSLLNSCWVLTDENDNTIIGVNQDLELLDTITFDFNSRIDGIKYKY